MRAFAIALLLPALTDAQEPAWTFSERPDAFDDHTSYVIESRSEQAVEDFVGEEQHALLQLRCDKRGAAAYWRLQWPTLLATTNSYNTVVGGLIESTSMQLRFDDGRVFGSSSLVGGWPPDAPIGATQSVSTAALKAVLNQALKAKVMRVRDTAWDGKTINASFSLSGFQDAVKTLSEHCSRL